MPQISISSTFIFIKHGLMNKIQDIRFILTKMNDLSKVRLIFLHIVANYIFIQNANKCCMCRYTCDVQWHNEEYAQSRNKTISKLIRINIEGKSKKNG